MWIVCQVWWSYGATGFEFDVAGWLIGIHTSLWDDTVTYGGEMLNINRAGLIDLFGHPIREGMEDVAGPPYVVVFQLENNITVEFFMAGPEDYFEAQLVIIVFPLY